jgi:hypothetical protein
VTSPASYRLYCRRGLDALGSSSAECASVVLIASAGLQVLHLAAIMPHRYALLGAGAGPRQGEAFRLALDRIDQDEGMITVDRQVIVVDRHPVLASPETSASLRDVPMTPCAVPELAQ